MIVVNMQEAGKLFYTTTWWLSKSKAAFPRCRGLQIAETNQNRIYRFGSHRGKSEDENDPHPTNYPNLDKMEISDIYTLAAGGALTLILVIRLSLAITRYPRVRIHGLMLKHIIYPYILRRYRHIGPWTRGGVIIHLLYVTVVLFCTSFKVTSMAQAGVRAAKLSLINTIPLYLGFHLGFVADVLSSYFERTRSWSGGWERSSCLLYGDDGGQADHKERN